MLLHWRESVVLPLLDLPHACAVKWIREWAADPEIGSLSSSLGSLEKCETFVRGVCRGSGFKRYSRRGSTWKGRWG